MSSRLQLGSDKFGPGVSAEGLWPLDRGADGTVNDELRKDTNGTGHTEQNGVEVLLSQAVVLEKDTGVL